MIQTNVETLPPYWCNCIMFYYWSPMINRYNYKLFLQRSKSNMKIEYLRFSRRIQTASKCSKNTIWYSLSIFDAHHLNSLDTFYHGNSKRREDVIPDNQKDNVSVWWVRKEKTLVKQNYMKEEEKLLPINHIIHTDCSLFLTLWCTMTRNEEIFFSEMNIYKMFFQTFEGY